MKRKLLAIVLSVIMVLSLLPVIPFTASAETSDLVTFSGTNDYGCFIYTSSWTTVQAGNYKFEMDCKITSGTPVAYPTARANTSEEDAYYIDRTYNYDSVNYKYTVTFTVSTTYDGNYSIYLGNYGGSLGGSGDAVFACANPSLYLLDGSGNPTGSNLVNTFSSSYYSSEENVTTTSTNKWRRRNSGWSCTSIPEGFFDSNGEHIHDELFSYYVSDNEICISGLAKSYSGAIEIPSSIGGYPVTAISGWAFASCTSLTSVTIPDSVTSIGEEAFIGCTGLTRVTIGNSVTSIGAEAFELCTGLANIDFSDSISFIGSRAFYDTAWYNNQPDGLVYAGKVAYRYKGTCPANVIINDGTLSIADCAFQGCTGLESITIPDSLITIDSSAFAGCSALTNITIPDSVRTIGWEAFAGCSALTSIIISDSVRTIGSGAFTYCSALTNIYYTGTEQQKSAISIDNSDNANDDLLDANWHYNYNPDAPECTHAETEIIDPVAATCTTDGSTGDRYCLACGWRIKGEIIPALGHDYVAGEITAPTCTEQGYTTYTCSRCGEVYVGNYTDKLLGYYVSNNEIHISSFSKGYSGAIEIPSAIDGYPVTVIDEKAFRDCTGLTSITIPDSVTSIGYGAFDGCTGLTSITIPDSVTSIGNAAFDGCSSLTSITIPDSVTSIGDQAFSGCTGLTSITIPDSVTSIGSYAFRGCTHLEYATLSNSMSVIEGGMFNNCTALESIIIPDSIKLIEGLAFNGCTALSDIYYTGDEDDYGKMSIASDNTCLFNATWHYNCNPSMPTCTHDETELRDYVAATCITDGYTGDSYCLVCGWKIKGETIPALGHDYQAVVTDPTCTEQGYTTHTCSRCGDSYIDSYTNAHGHSAQLINYSPATCLADGYSGDTYCFTCNTLLQAGVVLPALGHNYQAVVTSPTCTKQGYTTHTCSRCGDVYVDSYTDAHGHNPQLISYTPATCLTDGYSGDTYCSICNTLLESGSVLPALGHDYIAVVTPPTCMHGGYTTHTCSRCGDSYVNEYTAPTGHQCDSWVITKNATCTVEGQRVGNCKFCGIEMEEIIPTIAHAYDAWKYETLPSCENSGKIICTCLLCGDKKTITIDALGHEYSTAWTVDSEPTCTTAGHKSHHCIRCDAVSESTEIPANGHQYTSVTVNPTCTKGGYTQHICSVCGSSYKTDIVSASGHTFTHYAAQAPTCTEAGWGEYDTCEVCGYTTYEEIDAFGHDYQAVGNGYVCSHCGTVIENAQTEEHHYIKTIVKPTADSDGYTQYTCTDCGYYYRTDITHFESGAKFAISDAVVGAGKKVILTVSISNNPGIYSFSLGVSYDKSAMTLTGINNLNKLPGDLSLGVDKVLWLNNNHVNSTFNGGIFQLEFDISAHAVAQDYTVTLTYTPGDIVNYGLDDVNLAIEPGTVTVEGFSAGDLNGDGVCNNKDLVLMSEIYARNYTAYKAGKAHTESNRVKGYNLFGSLGMNLIKDVEIVVLGITIERVALDINNDGIINNYDLLTMMKYLRGEEVEIY